MEEKNSSANENSGMALSSLIIGIVGLICAFLPAWRGFGIIISIVAIIVALYSRIKAKHPGAARSRSMVGLVSGILALAVGSYFYFQNKKDQKEQETNAIPVEFHNDTTVEEDHTNALEKLQGLTDSSNTQ